MRDRRFKIIVEDRQGDRRHRQELYEAPSLEEIQEFLHGKSGKRDDERDGGWGW